MLRCRLLLFASTLLASGAAAAGAEPAWPAVSGELVGTLKMPRLAGAPPLEWHVNARRERDGLVLDVAASAPGLALHLEAVPPMGGAAGTWRIVAGRADVALWWPILAAQWPANFLPPDIVLAGDASFAGAGTWRGEEFSGVIEAKLSAGSMRSAVQGWSADGVVAECVLEAVAGKVALRSAQVRVDAIQVAGFNAKKLFISATAEANGRLAVQRAEIGALGGRIVLAPFTLDPIAPAVHTSAEISGVALGELAALVPQALAEARGQVAGRIAVNWSLRDGIEPGTGSLAVSSDTPAGLRLTNSPGLLTGRASPKIEFLPAWTGPLRRWLSIENPAYDVLRQIERGELPLIVEKLQVKLYPDGLDGRQSARVEVAARPTAGRAVERVTFAVNVTGPLTEVLKLGLSDRANVRISAPK